MVPGSSRYYHKASLLLGLYTGGTYTNNQQNKQQQQQQQEEQQHKQKQPQQKQQQKQKQQQNTSTTTTTHNNQHNQPTCKLAAEVQGGEVYIEVDLSATFKTINKNNHNNTNTLDYKQQHKQLQQQQYQTLNTKYTTQQQQLTASTNSLAPLPLLLVGGEAETLHQLTNNYYNNKQHNKWQLPQPTTKQHANTKAMANATAAAIMAAAKDAPPGHTLVGPGAYRHVQPGPSPSMSSILPPPELIPAVNPSLPLALPPPQLPAPTTRILKPFRRNFFPFPTSNITHIPFLI